MGRVTKVSEDMFDPSALATVRIHDEALASFEAGLPKLAVLYILYQRVLALKQAPVLSSNRPVRISGSRRAMRIMWAPSREINTIDGMDVVFIT